MLAFFAASPPCLVGIEACGTAHHWAREIRGLGHEVRSDAASYVKPYVKRGKTDAADAEAICEAVTRPTHALVPIKTAEQQAVLMLHRSRDLLVRQRTMLVNALRGLWPSWASVAPQGIGRVGDRRRAHAKRIRRRAGAGPRRRSAALRREVEALDEAGEGVEVAIVAWHKDNEASRRLATIPGVGPITASAIVATVTDPSSSIPPGTSRRGSDWLPQAAQQRRQRAPGRDLQAGRSLPAPSARAGCDRGDPPLPEQSHSGEAGWLEGLLARRPARLVSSRRPTRRHGSSGPSGSWKTYRRPAAVPVAAA